MKSILLAAVLAVVATLTAGCSRPRPRVVLYCAQDREFAEGLLADFTRQHGLDVAPKFDTESDKSVSLYLELVREKDRPRCDVFWNNEILHTLRLQKQGLLEPYTPKSAEAVPAWARSLDGSWHAFAARARVLIVNTERVSERERPGSLLDLTKERWKGQVVMARPQFGTTATQAACLFAVLGEDRARAYYRNLKSNGVHTAPGNKQVAEWVARGKTPDGDAVSVGVTDTDDAIIEVKAGKPVAIIFPDREGEDALGTLVIPNTLALIKGGPNPEGGRKLIDFLLTPAVEKRLAEGPSHQFPILGGVEVELPKELRVRNSRPMKVDFQRAADLWDEVQTFLRQEFATP